jgi:hypothetical protein
MSSNAADVTTKVEADGQGIMISTSKYSTSSGDEAGSLFGLISNKIQGSANPQMYSMDVQAEGKPVFRQLDIMLQNGGSMPVNTPPGPNNQPPAVVGGGAGGEKKDKPWKIISVQWADAKKKCGDLAKLKTKTENYDDGVPIAHLLHKTGEKRIHTFLSGPVNGNSVEIDWVTRNGPWTKKPTKLKIKAHGASGTKESSNELEIAIPAEFQTTVQVHRNLNVLEGLAEVEVPKFTIFGIGFFKKKVVQGSGKFFAWNYGYDLSLKQGILQILCKVKLVTRPGVKTGKKLRAGKTRWKQEIEATWDRKWKEHRVGCQRGDACDCKSGCCIFPYRVKCTFVDSGEHVQVNLWPGAPMLRGKVGDNPDWWNAANWYERLGGREGNGSVVHAHEFGHTIGMSDEYIGGSTMPDFFNVAGSLMQSGTSVMKQHFDRHPPNGIPFHLRFMQAIGDNGYKLLKC